MDHLFGRDDSGNESEFVEIGFKEECKQVSVCNETDKNVDHMDKELVPIKVKDHLMVKAI